MVTKPVDLSSCRSRLDTLWWLLAVCVIAPPAFGAVEFAPAISLGIARTDNLTLAPDGEEESQTVYQLTPSFTLSQQGPRLTSNVAYQLEGFYYDQRSESEVYNIFDAEVQAALDPENFFIEFGANRTQSIGDPGGPIPASNLLITSNRIDVDDAHLGPVFQYGVGGNAVVRGSLQRRWTRYDEDSQFSRSGDFLYDFDEDTVSLSVDNYQRESGFSWALAYSGQEADYGIFLPYEYRQARLELGGWAGDGLRFFAAGGKESAWDRPFDPDLDETFWEAGFSRSDGDRFVAEFAAGERSFGSSGRANLRFMFGSGSTELSYSEDPTTQGSNPYDRGGLLQPDEPDDFLARAGGAERYISKRAQWNLNIGLRRVDFSVTVFDESREQRTTIDGMPLGDESQAGAYFSASWQVGARTDIVLNVQRVHIEYAQVDERDLTTATIGASYGLGQRTRLSLDYSYIDEEAITGSAGPSYTAGLISLFVTRTF